MEKKIKKIMFNDKYGLTQAVLKNRKTQTRRVINLTETDKEYLDTAFDWDLRESVIVDRYAKYKVGEEVAIAQKYSELEYGVDWVRRSIDKEHAGWNNKMFVSAEEMPHRIKITNVRVERLQDISDEDCFKEGIIQSYNECLRKNVFGFYDGNKKAKLTASWKTSIGFDTPSEAYAVLIDKTCGKGTWKSNPWVFVYDFELVK